MRRTSLAVFCAALLCAGQASAQQTAPAQQPAASSQPSPAQTAQRARMQGCNTNATARGLKADARKIYLSACLSGSTDQKTIMKVCNAQAGQDKMTGDPRKKFMAVCLTSTS